MKKNLPFLNAERLNYIFENVYMNNDEGFEDDVDSKMSTMLTALKALQQFNVRFREEDYKGLFESMNPIFNFELNSEGTDLWLALILAIKEFYGFSDTKLVEIMKQVTVRK